MQDNYIISIGRSIGAGGLTTAKLLGENLGIKVYDSDIIFETAKQSGLNPEIFKKKDERIPKHRLTSLFGLRSLAHGNGSITTDSIMNEEALFEIGSKTIRQIAETESCIIVGRCADYILRDNPRCVSIFITATLEARTKRLMDKHGLTEDVALRHIEQGDKRRSTYYNYYTFKKWGDSSSYDLCIDSSKLDNDLNKVVATIKYYLQQRNII